MLFLWTTKLCIFYFDNYISEIYDCILKMSIFIPHSIMTFQWLSGYILYIYKYLFIKTMDLSGKTISMRREPLRSHKLCFHTWNWHSKALSKLECHWKCRLAKLWMVTNLTGQPLLSWRAGLFWDCVTLVETTDPWNFGLILLKKPHTKWDGVSEIIRNWNHQKLLWRDLRIVLISCQNSLFPPNLCRLKCWAA